MKQTHEQWQRHRASVRLHPLGSEHNTFGSGRRPTLIGWSGTSGGAAAAGSLLALAPPVGSEMEEELAGHCWDSPAS